MSLERPDNDDVVTLVSDAADATEQATDEAIDATGDAWNEHVEQTGQTVRDAASGTSSVVAEHGQRLAVTFTDIDRVVGGLKAVNTDVAPILASMFTLPSHPDLLASVPLSPFTAAGVTTAALSAAGRISIALFASEALTLVAASVVSSYELADAALSAQAAAAGAAAGIAFGTAKTTIDLAGTVVVGAADVVGTAVSGAADVNWQVGTALVTVSELSKTALLAAAGSLLVGFGTEAVTSINEAMPSPYDDETSPWELLQVMVPVVSAIDGLSKFSLSDAWANSADAIQGALGTTGPLFDDILDSLIRSGRTLGFFHDGETQLVDEAPIDGGDLRDRMDQAREGSIIALDRKLVHDDAGAILPRDVAELAASAGQVDKVGGAEFSTIRVISSVDTDGSTSYLVVIPSTQQWWPTNGPAANDLTADLYNLAYGGSELSDTVLEALAQTQRADGVDPGTSAVSYAGFSLGGITSGVLAAIPEAHATQVVTFGAPYANSDIPDQVGVIAYEAHPDLVPTLDGSNNPDTWTTIRDWAPSITDSEGDVLDGQDPSAHDANRYAVMAAEHPTSSDSLDDFFQGDLTVHDYYAVRK
ncbi:hypothetical protein JOE59_001683 [Agromyces cerinus]|uniref:hypothetical protein n=1 Tax=Agromyces cerinus TaxID=33878 RepID=UPI0019587802|nr:hypothetical protein [Agromyces cerinus]MBM7830978.1 hypothetical protein [Agromyces cerinus]